MQAVAGIALSAALAAAYARGAWPLAFVLLVPWCLALQALHGVRGTLATAVAMAIAYVVAAFGWFAPAVAAYTGVPAPAALGLLVLAAPALQPQFVAYALVRHATRARRADLRALLATAAWLATEWAVPRLFGDTLGHGLQPSRLLRQAADITGVGGLTLAILLVNEALVTALVHRRSRAIRLRAVLVAAGLPLLLAVYGAIRLPAVRSADAGPPLRIALVQAAITDYERLRRERGAYAVVREVLDTHYALSMDARARGADALVWPETVYPTTLGEPKSAAGGELDRELLGFVRRAGVPLVLGTYDRDAAGEYNAAAFVEPAGGLLGRYRKTRLFPLTEYVPPWLDGPRLRAALPWAGTWRPGDGARVFPLRLADAREVPVVPVICRDDLDPGLVRDGARLGAQLIVGLSNDAWFTDAPLGARLHLAAAAFRSIETRLPQVRATTNGVSAVIDPSGEIVARTRMGGRRVLLATVRPREATATPYLRWGDATGPVSALLLAGLAVVALMRRRRPQPDAAPPTDGVADALPSDLRVALLRPATRALVGALRGVSRIAVLVLGALALTTDTPPGMLAQIRLFAAWVAGPELAAAAILAASAARLRVDGARLQLDTRRARIEIDRDRVRSARAWRVPWPLPGFDLVLATGRWSHGIATRRTAAVLRALALPIDPPATPRTRALLEALDLPIARVDAAWFKFGLFPLVPALPAFRLHQLIAYGSAFGEYYSFGAKAYLTAAALWWASWAVALVLVAGGLRLLVEAGTAAALASRPASAPAVRLALTRAARIAYFVGIPGWLLLRLLGG